MKLKETTAFQRGIQSCWAEFQFYDSSAFLMMVLATALMISVYVATVTMVNMQGLVLQIWHYGDMGTIVFVGMDI